MIRNSLFLVSLLLLLIISGCGRNVKLTGKVTYSDDKSPVPTGTICFETDTHLARGTIQPDGTYTVGSLKDKDGLPPDTYRVYFINVHKELGYDNAGMMIYEPLITEKYASGSTSGITLDVSSSTKTFDVEVDRRRR